MKLRHRHTDHTDVVDKVISPEIGIMARVIGS